MLDSKNHINSENGFLIRYVRSDTEYFRPHKHNYFEIFMVVKGPVRHIINGAEQVLSEGDILFIRDYDEHEYVCADNQYFEFLNVAISPELLRCVLDYLGDDFSISEIMNYKLPPVVSLLPKKREKIFYSLTELDQNNPCVARLKIKNILVDLFVNCFFDYHEKTDDIPKWLEAVYEKMKNPKYFIKGAKEMYCLSGKSREHLTRCMSRFYGKTPAEYINDLRLEYSAGLLRASNLPVVDICFACGFENLSWFYKQFSKKFGETPSKYRKKCNVR